MANRVSKTLTKVVKPNSVFNGWMTPSPMKISLVCRKLCLHRWFWENQKFMESAFVCPAILLFTMLNVARSLGFIIERLLNIWTVLELWSITTNSALIFSWIIMTPLTNLSRSLRCRCYARRHTQFQSLSSRRWSRFNTPSVFHTGKKISR